jgi:NNP family nitrate/nitrite transporter-like MFS transporter
MTTTPVRTPQVDEESARPEEAAHRAPAARSHWIDDWRPEDPAFWAATGKRVARRNLIFSIVAEHIGFSVWLLWSIVVVRLNDAGFALTVGQMLWLTAVPSGVGALLRLPYTFAVPVFGGRNWTVVSALLLVVPCLGLAWAVQHPDLPYGALLAIAATAGLGGGNFASSMANISFFYPEKEKGWALGLNAAGGNIGVAVVQKVVPLVVVAGGGLALSRAGLMYIPLAVAAAVLAFCFMDNLSDAKADPGATAAAATQGQTWLISFLYIGTFGSFIGYSAAFPTLLKTVYARPDIALSWGFLGALVGSVTRPLGGRISDRFGGAKVTLFSFALMIVGAMGALRAVETRSLGLFFASFMALFVATGIGNGSTYRMIPAIFRSIGEARGGSDADLLRAKREAAGAIGIASAVGAFGGFLVPIAYAWSKDHAGSITPALQFYVGVFVVMFVVTWAAYLRKGSRYSGVGA